MTLIAGELAFLWASIISLPITIAIQLVLNWVWRFSVLQKVLLPGADECRGAENIPSMLMNGKELSPHETELLGRVMHGLLIRNGLNALANALIFAVVFTGSHALLMAL